MSGNLIPKIKRAGIEKDFIISGVNVCAHPNKGGLQPILMQDQKAMARYQRAKKALAHQKINLTG